MARAVRLVTSRASLHVSDIFQLVPMNRPMLCKGFLAHVIENDFGAQALLGVHAVDPDLSIPRQLTYNLC